MLKKFGSLSLVLVLIATVFGKSALAKPSLNDELKTAENGSTHSRVDESRNEKLRSAINKLISDVKAERAAPVPTRQIPPKHSNNLSKGAKIAIVAGIVVAVVAIIVVAKADKGPTGNLGPLFGLR